MMMLRYGSTKTLADIDKIPAGFSGEFDNDSD